MIGQRRHEQSDGRVSGSQQVDAEDTRQHAGIIELLGHHTGAHHQQQQENHEQQQVDQHGQVLAQYHLHERYRRGHQQPDGAVLAFPADQAHRQ